MMPQKVSRRISFSFLTAGGNECEGDEQGKLSEDVDRERHFFSLAPKPSGEGGVGVDFVARFGESNRVTVTVANRVSDELDERTASETGDESNCKNNRTELHGRTFRLPPLRGGR